MRVSASRYSSQNLDAAGKGDKLKAGMRERVLCMGQRFFPLPRHFLANDFDPLLNFVVLNYYSI